MPIMTPKRKAQQASPMYSCGSDEHCNGSGSAKTDLFTNKKRKHAKLGAMSAFISGRTESRRIDALTTTMKPPKHAYAMWGIVGLSYFGMSE